MQPTPEQEARLARITNPQQREALLEAIAAGEEIPEFAWTPVPDMTPEQETIIADAARELVELFRAGADPDEDFEDPETEAALLAERLRDEATTESSHLVEPVPGCDFLKDLPSATLLLWAYFNPFGPTICALGLYPLEEGGLIGLRVIHPFSPEAVVYGLVPDLEPDTLRGVLPALFERNGHPEHPLVGGLPTSIVHGMNYHAVGESGPWVGPDFARTLFRSLLPHADTEGMAEECAAMRAVPEDPWERLDFDEEVDDPRSPEELFDEWFDLVTRPEHVGAEDREFPGAWRGAIAFAAGEFD